MEREGKATLIDQKTLKGMIDQANTIAITVHIHPDGDALGSMLGLYEYLKIKGKTVYMVLDDVVPHKFTYLPYEKDVLFINNNEKQLTETLSDCDLLIILDASTLERIGKVKDICTCPYINIDHHVSNSHYADYLYLDSHSAATGEILVTLLEEWQEEMTPSMGNAFYLAIATDCGFFKFGNTRAETLEKASLCVHAGAKPDYVSDLVELSTPERLMATQKALETVNFYEDNRIGILVLNKELMTAIDGDTDGFVDFVRNIETVDIAILFKEEDDGAVRISLRSKEYDVNQLASQFKGGGHIRAAGCTVHKPLSEAVSLVVDRASRYLREAQI